MSDDKSSTRVRIRANAAGFGGTPISLYAMFDTSTEVLVVAKDGAYDPSDRSGFLRLTTRESDACHDAVYREEDVRESIAAFFDLDAMNLVQFGEGLNRWHPKNKIETDGVDEHGVKYRFAADIANGHVAVLMIALWATRQRQMAGAAEFMDDLLITI